LNSPGEKSKPKENIQQLTPSGIALIVLFTVVLPVVAGIVYVYRARIADMLSGGSGAAVPTLAEASYHNLASEEKKNPVHAVAIPITSTSIN